MTDIRQTYSRVVRDTASSSEDGELAAGCTHWHLQLSARVEDGRSLDQKVC